MAGFDALSAIRARDRLRVKIRRMGQLARMNGKPQLLCVGRDAVLNRTRRLILEKCFEVRLAHSEEEAVALLAGRSFALVLLCYSLMDDECRAIVEVVHGLAAPAKILFLGEGLDRNLLGPQDEEFVFGGPADLVKKAASMAGFPVGEAEKCAAEEAEPGADQKLA